MNALVVMTTKSSLLVHCPWLWLERVIKYIICVYVRNPLLYWPSKALVARRYVNLMCFQLDDFFAISNFVQDIKVATYNSSQSNVHENLRKSFLQRLAKSIHFQIIKVTTPKITWKSIGAWFPLLYNLNYYGI